MTQQDDADEGDRQFVSALARGLDILGCFKVGDRFLSNHQIAQRTGLARPTVSRLTYTLTKTGHLTRDEGNGAYRLSPAALQLGFSVLAATSISERFASDMEGLLQGPNPYVTVALAERSGTRAVYLASRRSQQAVSLSIDVGARLPLFYSAVGRAILVRMAAEAADEVLVQAIREFPDQKKRLKESLEEARKDFETFGYCTSFGAWKTEANAIAAPLLSLDGTTIYGVNVGGPSFLVTPKDLHEQYGARLIHLAQTLGFPKRPPG